MTARNASLKIGLAVGGGTGPELRDVFEKTLLALGDASQETFSLQACPRLFRTYASMAGSAMTSAEVARVAKEDAAAYEAFLFGLRDEGCKVVFRTAFNAETIYLVRERLRGVKVETLQARDGEFLLIRDEAQGFYAGSNNAPESSSELISRTCEFSKEVTCQILDFSLRQAEERWGGGKKIDRIIAVYKFHLLDSRFVRWIEEYAKNRSLRIELYQPDTMNRCLLRGDVKGHALIVGSNEWLDIMHGPLLERHGGLVQDERCTWNAYLSAEARGMIEYQTVHGSADDIAGQGKVNPLATMRAAAAILARYASCVGASSRLEEAIKKALASGCATPDRGGSETTSSMAAKILSLFGTIRARKRD